MVNHNRSYEPDSTKKSEPDPKLAFYEKLSSKKVEAKQKSEPRGMNSQEKVPDKPSTGPQRPADRDKESSTGFIKERPIEEIREALLEKKNADKKPLSKNATPGDGDFFTIQLASLAEKVKAQRMIDRLIRLGYPAYFYDVNVKGKTYYRVRCGRFSN
ncbi:MAG: SPOR domain-containing protein, partial [Deltaproteobacteria bacterium]|nr:SPOR domain-containing protein [Deltaproteobacteria bacterium]